ncbi:MAG: Gfo/Idh/MocA family oxidoreductase [Rhodothermales bacterium]
MTDRVRIAQVGVGYWGKNLLRNFHSLADVQTVCDANPDVLSRIGAQYPGVKTTGNFDDILNDERVQAVVVATETPLHFDFARRALEAGKHVFVEKPMAQTVEQAEDLVRIADDNNVRVMVGHLLLYHPAFRYVEGLIRNGDLGEVYYVHSQRVNLGIIRQKENAFESLAPHDLSIALMFIHSDPVAVSAQGHAYLQDGIEDVVFATVYFASGQIAHLHTSWLDPQKQRAVTVVGSNKMAIIDDVSSSEKVRLYDKGVVVAPGESRYAEYAEAMSIRDGDIVIPKLPTEEPLRAECKHFVDCVATGTNPRSDGRNGLAVVRMLSAAMTSLRNRGAAVEV